MQRVRSKGWGGGRRDGEEGEGMGRSGEGMGMRERRVGRRGVGIGRLCVAAVDIDQCPSLGIVVGNALATCVCNIGVR